MWLRIFLAQIRIRKNDQAAGSAHRRKGQHDLLRYEDRYYCGAGRSGAIIITDTKRSQRSQNGHTGWTGATMLCLASHLNTERRGGAREGWRRTREEAAHYWAQEAENHGNDDCRLAEAGENCRRCSTDTSQDSGRRTQMWVKTLETEDIVIAIIFVSSYCTPFTSRSSYTLHTLHSVLRGFWGF